MTSKREAGREIMAGVLGPDYFAKRDASTNRFNAGMRRFSEENCFGDVWARPGLEKKQRSLLCLAMLIALDRPNELRIHLGGALNNGCTVQEIEEVLYQSIIYCGLPAAVEAYRVAEEVLRGRGLIE